MGSVLGHRAWTDIGHIKKKTCAHDYTHGDTCMHNDPRARRKGGSEAQRQARRRDPTQIPPPIESGDSRRSITINFNFIDLLPKTLLLKS